MGIFLVDDFLFDDFFALSQFLHFLHLFLSPLDFWVLTRFTNLGDREEILEGFPLNNISLTITPGLFQFNKGSHQAIYGLFPPLRPFICILDYIKYDRNCDTLTKPGIHNQRYHQDYLA
jgi:hypothetical protein